MKYCSRIIGDREYKMRIASRQHAELDKAFKDKGGFVAAMQDQDTMTDQHGLFMKIMPIALRGFPENGTVTPDAMHDLYDELVDSGWGMDDFAVLVMEIGETSGFFPRGTTAGLKAEREKARAELEAEPAEETGAA